MNEVPLKFSDSALIELKSLRERHGINDGRVIRVGVRGGGCAGQSFFLAFDFPEKEDHLFNISGWEVAISIQHSMYIIGMEIGFVDEGGSRGFVFSPLELKQGDGAP